MDVAQEVDEKMESFRHYISYLRPELWSLKCQ